jgi:hypothetical protein
MSIEILAILIGLVENIQKIINTINWKQYNTVLENLSPKSDTIIFDIGFGNEYSMKKLFKKIFR